MRPIKIYRTCGRSPNYCTFCGRIAAGDYILSSPSNSEDRPRQPSKCEKSEKVRSSITHFHLYFQIRDRPEVTPSGVHFLSNSFSWSPRYLAASAAPLTCRRHLVRRQSITCRPEARSTLLRKFFILDVVVVMGRTVQATLFAASVAGATAFVNPGGLSSAVRSASSVASSSGLQAKR